jgi:hypothetical protein
LLLQATNTALSSQLADTTAAAARERQLLLDRLAAAEREWQSKLHDANKQVGGRPTVCSVQQRSMPLL